MSDDALRAEIDDDGVWRRTTFFNAAGEVVSMARVRSGAASWRSGFATEQPTTIADALGLHDQTHPHLKLYRGADPALALGLGRWFASTGGERFGDPELACEVAERSAHCGD
jgi:hypothetical protein